MLDCGHETTPSDMTPGYGIGKDGRTNCFDCCAKIDEANMIATGRFTGYITRNLSQVSNWPGSLWFPVRSWVRSSHNMAHTGRFDFWFVGPDGYEWHGVNIGDNEIARCKRTKRTASDPLNPATCKQCVREGNNFADCTHR